MTSIGKTSGATSGSSLPTTGINLPRTVTGSSDGRDTQLPRQSLRIDPGFDQALNPKAHAFVCLAGKLTAVGVALVRDAGHYKSVVSSMHTLVSPTVSVITPSHNAAAILGLAIRSVADQTLAHLEHILIDDGSTDGTGELLQELSRELPHLRYIHQRRQGAGMARNLGIEAAEGRYIAFLDSDDLWLPRKLESQVRFMEERQSVFSYGDYLVQGRDKDHVGKAFRTPVQLTHRDLLRGCPIGCLTAAYNQEALGKAYMPRAARGQDWALWLSLTRDGTLAKRYPGTEAVYHRGRGSLSANKLSKSLDMYRIYRQQERIGAIRTLGYLASFSIDSLRKRWVAG